MATSSPGVTFLNMHMHMDTARDTAMEMETITGSVTDTYMAIDTDMEIVIDIEPGRDH
jgi:hypothetical protein